MSGHLNKMWCIRVRETLTSRSLDQAQILSDLLLLEEVAWLLWLYWLGIGRWLLCFVV